MKIFKHTHKILNETFPENWIDSLDSENLESEIKVLVEKALTQIFPVFYESILSGEYILKNYEKNNIKFEKLSDFINQEFDEIGSTEEIQKYLDEHIKEGLVDCLKRLIRGYKLFSAKISTLTTNFYQEIEFDIDKSQFSKSKVKTEYQEEIELFYIYLNIQLLDHFFEDSKFVYAALTEFLFRIKHSTVPQRLKPAVIEKINYLKHKWILRQYKYSKDDDTFFYRGYISDGEIKNYFDDEEFSTNNEKLNKWNKYLENHYELSPKWQNQLTKEADKIKNKKLSDLDIFEIIKLVKFYKDIKKNPALIKELVETLKKTLSEGVKNNNQRIYEKALIYSINNYYSALIEAKNFDEGDVVRIEIEKFQQKFSIDNFFADKKLITYQLKEIESEVNNRNILNDLSSVSVKLEKLELIVKRCRKRMDWAYSHHSLIFQLTYKQSLVPTSFDNFVGIYYASTFALPIPKHSNQKEFNEQEIKFEKLKLISNTITSLNLEFKEVEKIQSELEDNDFKSLQMIAVFTAIVAFIITTIPAFTFIDSFEKAIYFYTILGGTMITMVLGTFLVRRKSEIKALHFIPIICLVLLIVCAIVFFKNIN